MSAAPKVLSLQDHTFKKRQPQPSVGLAKTGARVVSATRSRVSTPEQEIQQVIRQLANFKRQAVGKSKAYATKLVQVTQKRLSTLFSKPAVRQYIQHLDEASHATLMADFQAVLVFKSQIKLVPTRQVVDLQAELQRAQQLFKAGSGAGSDDDAGTPRSDTSTDSLDEAMRNHEPRRSRGNSTDSDDSDRSVAAGATTSSSHSETARLKILTSILRVLTPLRQELNGLQDTITLAKKRSARRHEALFKQMVAEAELFRQTTVEIADDTLEQMKVSDQSGLQKILIRVTDELQSTRDAIRRFKSALGIR